MLKLYTARNSICTQKVFITLAEKGLDYDTHDINLFINEQYTPEYLKINPKGVVPALDHDGRIVTELTLICEYLDDVFPSPMLIPADPYLRTKMRMWSKAVDEGLFEATRELSFSAMFREKMRDMTPEQREGRFRNVGNPGKRARFEFDLRARGGIAVRARRDRGLGGCVSRHGTGVVGGRLHDTALARR